MSTASVQSTVGLDADLVEARKVVDEINDAWAKNDADLFADVYTDNASFILSGDRYFQGRNVIHQGLKMNFAGPHKGTSLITVVVEGKLVAPGVATLVTEGGVLLPGQTEPDWERALRATWVVVKEADRWRVAAYQNGRRADGALKGEH
jgi:uncharacterized protein (TIGR02246 family)